MPVSDGPSLETPGKIIGAAQCGSGVLLFMLMTTHPNNQDASQGAERTGLGVKQCRPAESKKKLSGRMEKASSRIPLSRECSFSRCKFLRFV